MAETSSIEWTDATWNPITGCSVVSPGCTNCYAMKLAGTRLRSLPSRKGLTVETKAGPVWNGRVRLNEEWLTQPLRWRRPRKIFVCAHGDLFAENVPDEWIDRVFAVMALAPQHTFQVLTKRAARMREYLAKPDRENIVGAAAFRAAPVGLNITDATLHRCAATGYDFGGRWPLPNVWLGVSAEDQRRADERVPDLLATPAAVRFVSAEPLLGPLDLNHYLRAASHRFEGPITAGALQWVIAGGESGPGARPMHPAWARQIRDACAEAGVAFHFKQWGAWGDAHPDWPHAAPTVMADDGTLYLPQDIAYPDGPRYGEAIRAGHERARLTNIYRVGKKAAGRLLDGVEHNGFPEVRHG